MKEEVTKSLEILKAGKSLLYPTDTVWGIGCDATSESAVTAIYKIKNRSESKSLIILVSSVNMLKRYIEELPENVIELIELSDKPTTIIYNNPIDLANNVIAKDNTIAIRIVKDGFCNQLITAFGKPIVSTSANISGRPTPTCYNEIENHVLHSVDYIVNLQHNVKNHKSSTILKILKDGTVAVLRK